ncbi:MAG: class I SAM-dependent methyltransferase [Chloracidobacterium sp.]|nr:class I SAM-dependent methyltransferase [Chloracidobacterium sp.]
MLKEKILESSLGYALWSAPINNSKEAAIKSMLAKCPGVNRILDVGCGPGTNAHFFSGWDYVGIDLNQRYIEDAKKKHPDKRFFSADATGLDLDGERFPLILINSLMHHLSDEECAKLLEGIRPILTEGGRVIVQEPLIPSDDERLMRFLMKQDRGDYFRTRLAWDEIFAAGGFAVAAEEFYTLKLVGLISGWHMYSVLLTVSE